MKKLTYTKNCYKSPPLSFKKIKSYQKLPNILSDLNESQQTLQTMKIKVEKISNHLNMEIKQREFQFKELYKMITELRKPKQSKCKHNIVSLEKKNIEPVSNIGHMPVTATSSKNNNQQSIVKITQVHQNSRLNDQNDVYFLKRQKRRSKCGTIQSHKNLPLNSSQVSSNYHYQPHNEEEQLVDKTTKNLLSTSSSHFFSQYDNTKTAILGNSQILSPLKTTISISNHLQHQLQDLTLKINYFEQRIKSLQVSQNHLSQNCENQNVKIMDLSNSNKQILIKTLKQDMTLLERKIQKQLNSKLKVFSGQKIVQQKIREIQKITQEKFNDFKEEVNLNYKSLKRILQAQIQVYNSSIEEKFLNLNEKSSKYQSQFKSFSEGVQKKINNIFSQFESIQKDLSLKDTKNSQSNIDYSFSTDKLLELETRLDSTEQIVSQLMKVSLTLTSKINANQEKQKCIDSQNYMKKQKNKPIMNGLSDSYWALKQQLSKIDQESVENSINCFQADESLINIVNQNIQSFQKQHSPLQQVKQILNQSVPQN